MQTSTKVSLSPQRPQAASRDHILLFAAGSALIALLIFAYYAWTWRNPAAFRIAIDRCTELFCDFARYYYPMGETIFRTGLPVEGFVYSPFIAILLAMFPPLGLNTSLILWGVLQAASILLYFFLFRWLVPARLPVQLLFVALTLASFPLLHNLAWGQVGLFTTLSILGALVLYERGHRVAAAVLLVFGISFKFSPLIFLVPFVIRRDTRFLLVTAAACGVFLLLVPGTLLGVGGMARFYAALLESYRHFDWVVGSYNSQYFPHVIVRLVEAAGPAVYDYLVHLAKAAGRNVSDYLVLLRWIAYALMLASLGLIFLVQRARLRHANLWSFHILFLSIPFVHQTSWPVDLIYIPFAQTLLIWQLFYRETEANSRKWTSPGRVSAALFLITSIVISSSVFFNLYRGHFYYYGFYGFIFWADLLLLVATYLELLPATLRKNHEMPLVNRHPVITVGPV